MWLMISIELIDFLKNAELGSLKLEDSKEKVLEYLGNPEDVSSEGVKDLIWKYGNLEITFGVSGIACFFIENGNSDRSSVFSIANYDFYSSISVVELKELLVKFGIDILRENFVNAEKSEGILFLPHKVRVSFCDGTISSYSICDHQKFVY